MSIISTRSAHIPHTSHFLFKNIFHKRVLISCYSAESGQDLDLVIMNKLTLIHLQSKWRSNKLMWVKTWWSRCSSRTFSGEEEVLWNLFLFSSAFFLLDLWIGWCRCWKPSVFLSVEKNRLGVIWPSFKIHISTPFCYNIQKDHINFQTISK